MKYKNHTEFFEAMEGAEVSIIHPDMTHTTHVGVDEFYSHIVTRAVAETKGALIDGLTDILADLKNG